jgi:hypothetical protein
MDGSDLQRRLGPSWAGRMTRAGLRALARQSTPGGSAAECLRLGRLQARDGREMAVARLLRLGRPTRG